MASSIASLNVRLTAGIAGFTSSMSKAGRSVASFGSSVTAASARVAGIGLALGAVAAGALVVMTKRQMTAIDATAKLSDRLGIQTEKLIGLQHASDLAGVGAEGLATALSKMNVNISAAATKGSAAEAALTELGLSATELANIAPDEAFKRIAQSLSETANPMDRARLATELFGKSGAQLLPLLTQGAAGIEAAQAEAERLGITFSRVDAARVEQANDAMRKAQKLITSVGQTLAIELSPFVTAAADSFTAMGTAGEGIGPKVVRAFEWVVTAVAKAADYLQLLPMAFYGFRAGALTAIAAVLRAIDYLGSGLVKIVNLLPGVDIAWTDTFSNMTRGLEAEAAEQAQLFNDALGSFQRGDNAARATKAFEDIRKRADENARAIAANADAMRGGAAETEDFAESLREAEQNARKVTDTITSLQSEVATFGMSDSAKKLFDLEALGASASELSEAAALLDRLDGLKAQDALKAKAESIIDGLQTPIEKYNESLEELNRMLLTGLLTQEQFDAAALAARPDITRASAPSILSGADADRFQFAQARGLDRVQRDDIPKRQLDEAKDANETLAEIARNTRRTPVTVVDDF